MPDKSDAGAEQVPAAKAAPRRAAAAAKASERAATPDDRALLEHRLELISERLRRLNERIIAAGREAGEATLTSYEKALKTIAHGIENVPGSGEMDWLAQVATAQAKFIRDLTDTWTKAARSRLKCARTRVSGGWPACGKITEMDPSRKRAIRLTVALSAALLLATALVYVSFASGQPELTASQLLARAKPGDSYVLAGTVLDGSCAATARTAVRRTRPDPAGCSRPARCYGTPAAAWFAPVSALASYR